MASNQKKKGSSALEKAAAEVKPTGGTYAGFDVSHFPGPNTMATYREQGFVISGMYLTHGPGIVDYNWIHAAASLAKAGWGLVPIYFGLQLVTASGKHVSPPADPMGAADRDAKEAIKLAREAGLEEQQTLYLDVETTFPKDGKYEAYLLKWIELVRKAKYNTALYCHLNQLDWARSNNLDAWTVHLNAHTGHKDVKTGVIHYSYLSAPLPDDPIDQGAIGTQTRFFCRVDGHDLEIDYDRFLVSDPSRI
jgi:hypothetical protein